MPKSNLSNSSKEHRNNAKIFNEEIDGKTLTLPNFANREKELLEHKNITKELTYMDDPPWNLKVKSSPSNVKHILLEVHKVLYQGVPYLVDESIKATLVRIFRKFKEKIKFTI